MMKSWTVLILVVLCCALMVHADTAAANSNTANTADVVAKLQAEQSAELAKLNAQIKTMRDAETKAKDVVKTLKDEVTELKKLLQETLESEKKAKTENAQLKQKLNDSMNNPVLNTINDVKARALQVYAQVSTFVQPYLAKVSPFLSQAWSQVNQYAGPYIERAKPYIQAAYKKVSTLKTEDVKQFLDVVYTQSNETAVRIGKELVRLGVPAAYSQQVAQGFVLSLLTLVSVFLVFYVIFPLLSFFFCCCRSKKVAGAKPTSNKK